LRNRSLVAPLYGTACVCECCRVRTGDLMAQNDDVAVSGRPPTPEGLLQVMDFNCWEMFRENARLGRGGELLETAEYYMAYAPRGTFFHNMVMLRDA
jgi:hypothetical protein